MKTSKFEQGGFVASRGSATFTHRTGSSPLPEGVPEPCRRALEGSRMDDFANPVLEALEGSRTEDFANPLPEALEGSRMESFANPVPEALEGNSEQKQKKNEPKDVVKNWLRSRSTIEFLGLWEQISNPDFKGVEFDSFRQEAGANAFTLSPQKWIQATNAIGVTSKSGRYGGTFAHKDIV